MPGSFSVSPLPTAHPSRFQPTLVRPSMCCYAHFSLAMGSSPGFGSTARDYASLSEARPIRTRFPCGSAISRLTLPRTVTRRLILQKARRHPDRSHWAPTDCRHTVSGSISLPSPGFFSPFPHGTGSLSVTSSVEPWKVVLPDSYRISRVP